MAWHGVAWRGAARRVAQRDLRFNNVSLTYALLAFLASFVSSCLSRSSYLSLSLVPFLGLVSFASSLSPLWFFFLSLLLAKTTAPPRLDVARTPRGNLARLFGACDAVKLLCIYYRTITNDVPLELCHSRVFHDGDTRDCFAVSPGEAADVFFRFN